MEQTVEVLFQKGIAPATVRLYGAGASRYRAFCKTFKYTSN